MPHNAPAEITPKDYQSHSPWINPKSSAAVSIPRVADTEMQYANYLSDKSLHETIEQTSWAKPIAALDTVNMESCLQLSMKGFSAFQDCRLLVPRVHKFT